MLSRLSLRARLILGVIALAAVGLVTADVVTYSSLRSFLLARTDTTLVNDAHALVAGDGHSDFFGGPGVPGGGRGRSLPVFAQVRALDGTSIRQNVPPQTFGDTAPPTPLFPRTISVSSTSNEGLDHVSYFTVGAADSSERYRVRASVEPGWDGMLVVALSLHDVEATLHRLLLIELLVTALVLAGVAVLGLWVVRLGLKPLDAIGATAAAIASGDLSRRVERAEERTEVGRLGLALNAMLAQIEAAFKARAASERKLRRFVADASHELRTPLAAVRAYAELFTRGAAQRPDDLARSMKGISRESERMSLLVEDLFLLARLDEGRPLERDIVRLDEVVAEAVETAQTVEPSRPIELEVEHAVVVGDHARLRQVLDNLLSNVRAHTPPGTPVHVSISCVNGGALVTVEDAGPGMDGDELSHVFERFYRADPSRARASGGVGLGLSIVAAVAEAHGGSVAASSVRGESATFTIALPLAPDPARSAPSKA